MNGAEGDRHPWGRGGAPRRWRPERLEVDEAALRSTVAELLGAGRAGRPEVTGLSREPSPFATLFPADLLRVRMDDGSELRLFLKHLGHEESDHPDKTGPEKEVGVYRGLLGGDASLPVPRFFGAVRNAASGRYEMFLEQVDGWTLEDHGLETWHRAAGELSRLHGRFAGRPELRECRPPLPRLGAGYAWGWALRAEREAARRGAPLRARARALLDRFGGVAALLEEATGTLVHNDLSPKNVVVDAGRAPARICFVDWESAGIGTGLLDLTNLSYGLDPLEREEMRRAYLDGLERAGAPRPDASLWAPLEAACEAHKALWRLAHCGAWGLDDAAVEAFLSEAEAAADRTVAGSLQPRPVE